MPSAEEPRKRTEHKSAIQSDDTKGKKRSQHVVRRNDGWAVMGGNSSRATVVAASQQEAIQKAREIARNQGSEVIIYSSDGRAIGREVFRKEVWELEPFDVQGEAEQSGLNLRKYIDTKYYGERPHIRGRRLLVSMIAANAEINNWNVGQLAYEFSLSEEQVLAALLYYREHKAEIDQQDANEQKQFDDIYRHQAKSE